MQTRSYEMTPAFFARSNSRAARRATPRWLHLAMVIVLAAAVLGLLACAIAPAQVMVFGPPTPALIGGMALGLTMILIGIRQRGLGIAYNRSVVRAGQWQASISDAGLQMKGQSVETLFRWPGLSGICQTPEGLQIMMGEVAHVPIPSSAFADAQDQRAFCAEVAARIAAQRGGK